MTFVLKQKSCLPFYLQNNVLKTKKEDQKESEPLKQSFKDYLVFLFAWNHLIHPELRSETCKGRQYLRGGPLER